MELLYDDFNFFFLELLLFFDFLYNLNDLFGTDILTILLWSLDFVDDGHFNDV